MSEVSDERRTALLPQSPALAWDELMVHPSYMAALDLMA
jgi:beta-N-acetylhexosaminidase